MNQFFEQILKDYPEFEVDPYNSEELICMYNYEILCRIESRENSNYVVHMYNPIGLSSYYYTWQSISCTAEPAVIANIKKVLALIKKIDKISTNSDCSISTLEQLGFTKKTAGEYWFQSKDLLVVLIIPHIALDRCYLRYKVEVSNGPYSVLLSETCDSFHEALSKLID